MADTAVIDDQVLPATKPVKVFRVRGLSVSVFRNKANVHDREVAFLNTTLTRTYKDGDEFKKSGSLGRDDLLIAQQLLGQAWQWIIAEEAKLKASKR